MPPRKARPRSPQKLYWVSTGDHSEDWFIVARSAARARSAHEGTEGYDPGDAESEFICRVPAGWERPEKSWFWPTDELLQACGAEFLPGSTPGSRDGVRIAGKVFVIGNIVANIAERFGLVNAN